MPRRKCEECTDDHPDAPLVCLFQGEWKQGESYRDLGQTNCPQIEAPREEIVEQGIGRAIVRNMDHMPARTVGYTEYGKHSTQGGLETVNLRWSRMKSYEGRRTNSNANPITWS